MRAVLFAIAAALVAGQAAPGTSCLCLGEVAARPEPEPRPCCGEPDPGPSEPCSCFHRTESDPATLDVTLAAPTVLSSVELLSAEVHARPIDLEVRRIDPWTVGLARGSPLYLLNSVLLI